MRKLLYASCLLAFMACSDDDDKIVTDYDKPYGKQTSTELAARIETNINACEELGKEFNEYMKKTDDNLQEIYDHYDVEIIDNVVDIMTRARASSVNETATFTGMRLTWNKEKSDFDTTINATGLMNVSLPSSVTDDSKNDLQIIVSVDYTSGTLLRTEVFKDEKLLRRETEEYNETNTERTQTLEYPPYSASSKIKRNALNSISTFAAHNRLGETMFKKEGGSSCVITTDVEKGDYKILAEYNNIRLRSTIYQYAALMALLNELDYSDEERYQELRQDLIQKNTKQNVVVFTDRDEKIGDWVWTGESDEGERFPIWKCTFKDGKEHLFRLYMPYSSIQIK